MSLSSLATTLLQPQSGQNEPLKPRYNPKVAKMSSYNPKVAKMSLSNHAATPLQHQRPLLQQSLVLADHTGMALAWISYPCIIPQLLVRTFRSFLENLRSL
jgi:hypothetical protein